MVDALDATYSVSLARDATTTVVDALDATKTNKIARDATTVLLWWMLLMLFIQSVWPGMLLLLNCGGC